VVTVEQDAEAWRDRVRQIHDRIFAHERQGGLPAPRLEIVDREVGQMLRRMETDGLIANTTQSVRVLWPRESEPARPSRRGDRQEVQETVRLAESHLRGAEQSEEESRARVSLREAILLLGRAFALHRHLPEPTNCEEALTGELAESWGSAVLVLWLFVADEAAKVEPAIAAVREVIEDLLDGD